MEPLAIEYIQTRAGLEDLAGRLARHSAVAADLEADSMHHFEEKVCLLQLGTTEGCYVVDPLAVADLSALAPVFADPGIVKIFHGADYDMRCLYRDFGINVENLFDTELAARFLGYCATSLEAVIARHFDIPLDKKFQKKDWSMRPLPEEMISYAADDVRYLVPLYREMKAILEKKGRSEWVRQHCKDIAAVRPEPPDDRDPLFLKIKGAGRLDPKSLAVLENLLAFRRGIARKKDRPPFKILGNQTLLELARQKPQDSESLEKSKLLSKKQFHMYGSGVIREIHSALRLAPEQRPSYPRNKSKSVSPAVTSRIRNLKQWRQQKAEQLEMDPALILNKAALRQLAEKQPKTRQALDEIPELKPWQKDQFADEWIRM